LKERQAKRKTRREQKREQKRVTVNDPNESETKEYYHRKG
jgi:hypothetical protein